jgi:hypothetical protein
VGGIEIFQEIRALLFYWKENGGINYCWKRSGKNFI